MQEILIISDKETGLHPSLLFIVYLAIQLSLQERRGQDPDPGDSRGPDEPPAPG